MAQKIFDKKEFSMMIERYAIDHQCTYLDAVVDYCEKNSMEIEVAAKLLNPKIKKTLEVEAMDANMLKQKRSTIKVE